MSFTDMTNWVVWSPQDKASGGLELHVLEGRRIAIREEAPIRLSSRQSQVLSLIVDGLTDAEAAEQLGISPRTVRMHADVLRVKLGVSRRRQLPLAYRRMRSLGRIELTLDGRPAE
ncbi:MAG: helix-turn-helix transcriptional regulator [Actinobacteria bacterium]|nr:MAG: helix-turn-helix transcriptional regulator [Actinomycetota bacterium]